LDATPRPTIGHLSHPTGAGRKGEIVSRGTDNYTVQQLMNFISEQMEAIDNSYPKHYHDLGCALMRNLENKEAYPVNSRIFDLQELGKKRNTLQELLWNIERKCGELWDVRQREAAEQATKDSGPEGKE
jgi:hypothetical protein